ASTGGFTEVLLLKGAVEVYAIDVGRGQLDEKLKVDTRVRNLEGVDARKISGMDVQAPVGALVCDVSFIALSKALAKPLMMVARGGWAIALIKPQFEAGPDLIGRDGIIRDDVVRERVINEVADWFVAQAGWRVVGVIPSPIAGGSGNSEYLIGAIRDA
ncbi:MAG: TlyA family rRNA (cytidine-2'-O)-methyltransferase, partial [Alphaproteobacteria bacterium]|nr:TlyA family rRNA (cytidine-2'-O)-methyltransferase [Alphaproteobacteria bacterium]